MTKLVKPIIGGRPCDSGPVAPISKPRPSRTDDCRMPSPGSPDHRSQPPRRHTPAYRYGAALLAVAVGFLPHSGVLGWTPGAVYFLFLYPAVFVGAWYGGPGPGLMATALATLLALLFVIPPYGSPTLAEPTDALRLVIFALLGTGFSLLSGSRLAAAGAAAEAEGRWRTLLDTAPITLWSLDAEGTITVAEGAGLAAADLRRNNLVGRSFFEVFKDAPLAVSCARRALQGEPFRAEMPLGERWYQTEYRPLKRADGAITGAVGVSVDVTERKRLELAARASEAARRELAQSFEAQARTFDTLLSTVPDFLYLIDRDHRFTYVNRPLLELWGKTLDEAVGKTFAELGYPPDLVEKHTKEIELALAGATVREENSYTNPSGYSGYYEYVFVPVRDTDGQVVAVAGATRDITRRKSDEEKLRQANEALENQQRWLEAVLDLLPLPVLMLAPDSGRIVFRNQAVDRMYGGPLPLDVPVNRFGESFHLTDAHGRRLSAEEFPSARVIRGEHLEGEEVIWHTRSDVFHLSVYSQYLPAMHGHPPVVLLPFLDISRLKQSEAALRESVQALEHERALRETFVATLTHDLRTPLSTALMSAQMIERGRASATNVARMTETLRRMDRMLQALLDANRLRAGAPLPIRPEHCRLRETVARVLDEMATVHGERFRFEAGEEVDGYWDCEAIRRIVENLAANAVKHGDPKADVVVSVQSDTDQVRIAVHNAGPAIAAEDLPRLFEPFQQANRSPVRGPRGWGIGLALVRGAAESHGGRVEVDSGAEGTTFTVILPRDARPQAQFREGA